MSGILGVFGHFFFCSAAYCLKELIDLGHLSGFRTFFASPDHADDSVPAAVLCIVELIVGTFNEVVHTLLLVPFADAEAHGDVYDVVVISDLHRTDLLKQAPKGVFRHDKTCSVEYHKEFLAAPSCDESDVLHMLPDGVGNLYENLVTRIVSVGIVDGFEEVDIADAYAEALRTALGLAYDGAHLSLCGSSVEKTGKRIGFHHVSHGSLHRKDALTYFSELVAACQNMLVEYGRLIAR